MTRPITVEEYRRLLKKSSRPRERRSRSGKKVALSPTRELEIQMAAAALPRWTPEHRFTKGRRWRFDYAWPELRIAVEVHGAVHAQGRHTRGQGFTNDREKVNSATLLGWRVLEVTSEQVASGLALEWIEDLLAQAQNEPQGGDAA